MKHLKTVVLCLVATCIVGALASATASAALPEWGACSEQAGGKYSDAGCTERAHPKDAGRFEWQSGAAGVAVRGEGGEASFQTPGGTTWQCSATPTFGFTIGAAGEAKETTIVLSGCESEGKQCLSTFGGTEGEVNNFAQVFTEKGLVGKLGYLQGKGTASPAVGMSFTSPEREGIFFVAQCEAAIGNIWVGGNAKVGTP